MLNLFGQDNQNRAWPRSVWVISDGTMGMLSQSLAVVRAMDIDADDIRAMPSPLLRLFPQLARLPGWQLTWGREPNWLRAARYPDLLISCGRRMAGLSIGIRRRSAGKTKTLHIQDAKLPPHLFDLMIVPAHDALATSGPNGTPPANVIVSTGSLNRLNKTDITEAAADISWPEQLRSGSKKIAVMLGGTNKRYTPDARQCHRLAEHLSQLARQHGDSQLILIPSRRTSSLVMKEMTSYFASTPHLIWTDQTVNPYPAVLDKADIIVVTSDSVNLTTEVCLSGKPVLVGEFQTETGRLAQFHALMEQQGYTQRLQDVLTGQSQLTTAPKVLDEMPRIVSLINARLNPEKG